MAAVAPRPSVPVVVAPRPQVPGTSGPRPGFTVVFAAAGHLVPQISHDLDVNMLLDVLVDVLAASLPIGVYDVPVDAAVVLDAVPAGVLPAGVSVATVVDVVSAAVAAAGVTAVAAVDAMSVAVVDALVEAVTVVAVDQFSIATASPSVDVPVVVDVSTVAVGGELLRDALVDVAVQVAASAVPVVAATVVASATIDSVETRIVLAAPAVDVAVQVSASVAGAVSAAALGVVTVDVATVPIVFRAVTVAPTVDVSTVSGEVAYRTANVSVTPTVSTTQALGGATYTDTFNRANGAIGSNWSPSSPQPVINTNAAQNSTISGNTPQLVEYNAGVMLSDNYRVAATVKTPVGTNRSTGTYFYVLGRCTGTGTQNDDIVVLVASGAALSSGIYTRSSGGTFTSRASISTSFVSGDVAELRCVGNVYTAYKNSTQIATWTDSGGIVPVDANHRGFGFGTQPFNSGYGFAIDEITAEDL